MVELELRRELQDEAKSHSNYWLMTNAGNEKGDTGGSCWADWTYDRSGIGYENLLIFFGKELWDTAPMIDEYVDGVLNHKHFGKAFLTESAEEAKEFGVELNMELPKPFVVGCAQILRVPFEQWCSYKACYSYHKLRERGIPVEEAIYFAPILAFDWEEGDIITNWYNSNHYPYHSFGYKMDPCMEWFKGQIGMGEGSCSVRVKLFWNKYGMPDPKAEAMKRMKK